MAKRKAPTKKRKQNRDWFADLLALIQRPDVMGVTLVLLSVLTLLSLLTSSTGAITGVWIGWLRLLFGVGVWGFPLVTGALGLWMVIRAVENMPDMSWQHPVGFALLFTAAIVGATLWMGPESNAGGLIGSTLAGALQGCWACGSPGPLLPFWLFPG
ncbi:MAG: hypothetical protein R3E79_47195 [Caldilineaceae bacterium]